MPQRPDSPRPLRSDRLAAAEGSGASTATEEIRVVLVEDHLALRRGIELLLAREGLVVAGLAAGGEEACRLIEAAEPDVSVIDVLLPEQSGAEVTRQLVARNRDRRILLYTGTEDRDVLRDSLDCGARGFALKAGAPEELIQAIRTVAAGGTYMDPRLGSAFLERSTTAGIRELSPREREILHLLAEGLTGAKIAQRLFLSPETVRTHVRNAMAKLEARTRVHAVVLALQQQMIPLDDVGDLPGAGYPAAPGIEPHDGPESRL